MEAIVTVVIAAAAVAAVRDAEHALHGPHRAADTGSDRPADHTTDRSGDPVALVGTFLRAAHDALGVPDMGKQDRVLRATLPAAALS